MLTVPEVTLWTTRTTLKNQQPIPQTRYNAGFPPVTMFPNKTILSLRKKLEMSKRNNDLPNKYYNKMEWGGNTYYKTSPPGNKNHKSY